VQVVNGSRCDGAAVEADAPRWPKASRLRTTCPNHSSPQRTTAFEVVA